MKFVERLSSKFQCVMVQETHEPRLNLCWPKSHRVFSSMGTLKHGGVTALFAHSWLRGWHARAVSIVPGRSLIVVLSHSVFGKIAVANVHAEVCDDCDAAEVLSRTREALVNLR
eukprot:973889-Amphidinium_carterae.1